MNTRAAAKTQTHSGGENHPAFQINTLRLAKRFNREWIFRNFSYSFTNGNVYAVTGPNGSGKSTLLQVLSSMMPQSDGEIHYVKSGEELSPDNVYSTLAFAAPYMDVIEEFTLEEHVNFHFKLKSPRKGMTTAEIIDKMYLQDSRNKFISNFSSGMKQRLKLGLAFYSEAAILLLDEPATNLDSQAFSWYEDELRMVPGDCITIIASNNPHEYPQSSSIIDILDYK